MSTDSKLEALRTGLEMAQELLAIKREALGDDYRLTRTYWEAERELQAALAEAEQEQAGEAEPVAWQERQEVRPGVFGEWYDRRIPWGLGRPQEMDSGGIHYQFRPLYTRPLEPLTQTKLIALWADKSDGPSNAEIVSFARAIERAHGITKEPKP